MFKKHKCVGCRKYKYFVKYRVVDMKGSIGEAKSLEKLCWTCGRKINKFTKQWTKSQKKTT